MKTGTSEYYRTIVLQGYFNENEREYLDDYFVREFKKAEKNNYSQNVFFSGCLNVLNEFNNQIDKLYQKQKRDYYFIVSDLKSQIEKESDTEKKLTLMSRLSEAQKELIHILENKKKKGFSYPVQLRSDSILSMQFDTEIINYIENSILKAQEAATIPQPSIQITKEQEKMIHQFNTKNEKITFNFRPIEIIELIKALIVNGNIKGLQKDIIPIVSSFFNIEVNYPDKTIKDLSYRNAGSETLFLDKLKTSLNEYIVK